MSRNTWTTAYCLLGVIVSLLLVGVVSSTLLRHVIQIIPAALVLVTLARRTTWGQAAALPIFIFWFLIMFLIWLYLLGLARIVTGRFSTVESVLTVVIGVCCVWGMVAAWHKQTTAKRLTQIVMFILSAALQIGAMWLSTRPAFSPR